MQDAELVTPRAAQDPEVIPALVLMVPAGSSERFEPPDFGFHIVSLKVEVHPLLGHLLIVGALEQDPDVRGSVREDEGFRLGQVRWIRPTSAGVSARS
nr:hypothetical protein [Phaeacidiphilus oryzae]